MSDASGRHERLVKIEKGARNWRSRGNGTGAADAAMLIAARLRSASEAREAGMIGAAL